MNKIRLQNMKVWRRVVGLSISLGVAGILFAQNAPKPSPLTDFVVSGNLAYGMMPPKPVAYGVYQYTFNETETQLITISGDVSRARTGAGSIHLVDLATGNSKNLLSVPAKAKASVEWLDANHIFVEMVSIIEPDQKEIPMMSAMKVELSTGQTQQLYNGPGSQASYSQIDEKLAMFEVDTANGHEAYVVEGSNAPRRLSQADMKQLNDKIEAEMREKYKAYAPTAPAAARPAKNKPRSTSEPVVLNEAPQQGIQIKTSYAKSQNKTKSVGRAEYWLTSDFPDWPNNALVCPEGRATLANNEKTVVIVNRGLVTLRQIVTMNMKDFKDVGREYEARVLTEQAKQVGTAINMYSQDYDGDYPPPGGVGDTVSPYMKDSSMFSGFEYVQPRPNADGSTTIGKIRGHFGTVSVFKDGSVRWDVKP